MKDLRIVLNPDYLELEPIIGLDLETAGLQAWEDKIRLIIISTSDTTYLLDVEKYHPKFLDEVFQQVNLCEKVIAHNAKFDCGFIYYHHRILLKNWFCTQIASNIITNGKKEYKGRHSLPEVIERYLGVKLEFSGAKKIFRNGKVKEIDIKKLLQKSFTAQSNFSLDSFTDKQLRYATADVKYLIPLYQKLNRNIENIQLKAIAKLENDLIPILSKMEIEGCLVDQKSWRELIKSHWEPELERLEQELDEEVKKLDPSYNGRRKITITQGSLFDTGIQIQVPDSKAINYGSSDQILDLFKKLGEEVPTVEVEEKDNEIQNKTTENRTPLFGDSSSYSSPGADLDDISLTKESLEEGVLATYINERPFSKMKPFILKLLEYRVAAKRISTYGEKFLSLLDENSKIHTGYTQTFTETGRLSSKAPNLQNLPAPEKGKDWTNIRRFFISRPGYKLITCDMESAEVYIAADYSQDPLLLASIREGLDMHSLLASISYSIICGEEIKISKSEESLIVKGHSLIPVTLRDLHKSVVFAKFYKGGAKRVYGVLAEYINMFHSEDMRMPISQEISKAFDKETPKLSGYLSNLIEQAQEEGYLRSDKLGRIRFFSPDVYGEAANYPIQGTNANALKMAMIQVYEYFETCGFDGRIVMNIHDELVCEVEDAHAEEAAQKIKEIMSGCLSYFLKTIKGKAGVKIGNCWLK